MVIDVTELRAQVREVHVHRQVLSDISAAMATYQAKLEQTEEWKGLQELKAGARTQGDLLAKQEQTLREMVYAAFKETGDKAPVAGVTVKQFKRVDFNPAEAMAWCKVNAVALVKEVLDPNYRNVAEALGGPVSITYEPRVTIATDLSKVVME